MPCKIRLSIRERSHVMGERGYCCLSFCIYFLNPLRRIRATPLARRAPFVYFIYISPVCGGIYSQRARLFNQPQDRISSHLSVHIIKTHGFAYHQPQGCISSSQRLAYHQGVNLAYFVMLSVSRNIYFEILRLRLRLLRMTSENKISPQ